MYSNHQDEEPAQWLEAVGEPAARRESRKKILTEWVVGVALGAATAIAVVFAIWVFAALRSPVKHTLAFKELTFSSCASYSGDLACETPGDVEYAHGTVLIDSTPDPSTKISGYCVTVQSFSSIQQIWQNCVRIYEFSDGQLFLEGQLINTSDDPLAFTYRYESWIVKGGTGAYAGAAGQASYHRTVEDSSLVADILVEYILPSHA